MKFLYLIKDRSEGIIREIFRTLLSFYPPDTNDFSKIFHLGSTGLQNFFAQIIFTHLLKVKSFIPPHFFTLKEFALTILEKEGLLKDYKLINENLKPIIILSLLDGDEKEKVTFGHSVILAEFISELKQYYYKKEIKEIFLKRLETFPLASKNLEFAFKIKERYERYLKKNKLLDEEDCQYLANRIIKEKEINFSFLIINGFLDFTNLEEDLITTLIKNSEHIFALSFLNIGKTFDFFLNVSDFIKIEYGEETSLPIEEEISKVPIYAYSTIEEESEGILKRIKLRHLEKKKNLSSAILVSPNLKKYYNILERVCRRLDLPYGIFRTLKLKDLPPFSFLIETLKTIDDNYPRLRTSLVFSLPYFEKFSLSTKRYINFLSKMARVVYGKNDWLVLKNTLLKIKNPNVEKLKEQRIIELIMKDIENFFILSENLKKNNHLSEFVSDFRKLLKELEFLKRENYDEIIYQGLLKFSEILAYLEDFDIFVDFPKFIKIIDYHFTYTPIKTEKNFLGIKVIDLHDLIIWDFSFMKDPEFYFFGLVEEDIPSKYQPEPLIPEYLKKEFDLPNSDLHLLREKSYFYAFLKTAIKNCYFSTHNYENENPVLLTPFLEVEKIKPKEEVLLSEEEFQILKGEKNVPFFNFKKSEIPLKNLAIKENPLSITKLVKYLKCPFQFYLEEVFKLSLEEEKSVEIEKWQWGNFIHLIMKKIYDDSKRIPEINELERIIQEKAKELLKEEISFEIMPIWQDFIFKLLERIIPQILLTERDLREKGYLPYMMEYTIHGEIIDGIYLKGRIDRIDKQDNRIFILDYKTGQKKPFTLNEMMQEKDLIQIVAYYCLWNHKYDLKCDNLGIYYLPEVEIKTPKEKELKEMEDYLLVIIKENVKKLRKGDFSVNEVDKNRCYNCNYQFLCEKNNL